MEKVRIFSSLESFQSTTKSRRVVDKVFRSMSFWWLIVIINGGEVRVSRGSKICKCIIEREGEVWILEFERLKRVNRV